VNVKLVYLRALYTLPENDDKAQEQFDLLCHAEYILFLYILADMHGHELIETRQVRVSFEKEKHGRTEKL
jgi:hypothetical protein